MSNIKNGYWIRNYNNPTDENIMEALHENAMSIRYVKNPSDSIIDYAINKNPFSIQYIKNPSIDLQMKALSRNVAAIQVIYKPCNEIIEYANQIDPNKMKRYVKNEAGNFVKARAEFSSVKLKNINNDIMDKIRNIENPSYEIQIEAIQNDYSALQYIKKINPKVYTELYFDKNFDVYDLDDFNTQLKIVSAFEILEKKYGKRTEEQTTPLISDSQENNGDFEAISNVDKKTEGACIQIKEFFSKLILKLDNSDMASELITTEIPLSEYINEFSISKHITDMYVACGYVYKTGLDMIETAINGLKDKQSKMDLIIGSLKDYYKASTDNKIINMDINTAKRLNYLINEKIVSVSTYEDQFYHGKYYFLQGREISCCIIGSSNLSLSGFAGNYELNTLYLLKNDCGLYKRLKEWFFEFKQHCIPIDNLLECNFANTNMVFDEISSKPTAVSVDIDKIENEVRMLTDKEVKFRLNLWLSKQPSNIYRQLNIENLNDYIAFEYKDYKLIVFESFISGNGYYYFDSNNIFETIEKIKQSSKTEIFQMSAMDKRGYHVKDANKLVKKIDSLFRMHSKVYEQNIRQSSTQNEFVYEHIGESLLIKKDNNSLTGVGIGNQIEKYVIYIMKEDSVRCPIHNTKMEVRILSFGKKIKDTVLYCNQCKKNMISQSHYMQIKDSRSFNNYNFQDLVKIQ
ncbi:phospholipase D-like domain-containing protein [Anaerocolumna sp. AGMB13020]|uniref:phospholipase D-like domain-containing protein n=1 Tax=Anaerocolumna sp. AGMB13020 TaxID=3081750 RepID=UPI002954481A|nr:phospholipase D-like domain-containing protein [Anaerocolumna sp. AGMB13020]WOO35814.1 phospholipase D-like domain-containing protein [Anaerocolumna sp. AGMB13020]